MDIKKHMQPSREAYQIAVQYPMGGLIAEHRQRQKTQKEKISRRIGRSMLVFLYLFMIGALLLLIVISHGSFIPLLQAFSSSFINALKFIGLTLLSLVLYSFVFVYIPINFYRNRNMRILRCTEGLIYCGGGRIITMHWDEIESVSESIWAAQNWSDKNPPYTCTLRLHGKKYAFYSNIEYASELGRTIEREITRRRIASYWHRIKHDEILRFGPLSISREGLYKGGDLVAWDQISQVHIFRGFIAIAKDGVPQKWPLVKVARIPNFFLFVALIHYLADGRVSYQTLKFVFRDYSMDLVKSIFRREA